MNPPDTPRAANSRLIRSAARVAPKIARGYCRFELPSVPKLNAHVRTMHHMGVRHDHASLDQITPDPFPRPPA